MSKLKFNIKGFTIVEVILTMGLTSILLIFSYSLFSYVHKLFYDYRKQNEFIVKYSNVLMKINNELLTCRYIIAINDSKFLFKSDIKETSLELMEDNLIFCSNSYCDTLKLVENSVRVSYSSVTGNSKVIDSIFCNVLYMNQSFLVAISKKLDADVKLKLLSEYGSN